MTFPDVDLFLNSNGVTIFASYLTTPRFVPFDLKGRCTLCKSDNVEIDYVLQAEGITIYCSRMRHEKFISFDKPATFNSGTTLRLRAKGKVYNMPMNRMGLIQEEIDDPKNIILDPPPPPPVELPIET